MQNPTLDADNLFVDDDMEMDGDLIEDAPTAKPKHGTSVLAGGWDAAERALEKKGDYATDFKFRETSQLIKFVEDRPFAVYEEFWVEKEGKKSYVSLGDDDPLAVIAGQKPRSKFSFNVVVLTDEEPNLQILTAGPALARQLKAANEDPRRGPLTRHYWAISRQGTGPQTSYTLERIRRDELAEDWSLDADKVDAAVAKVTPYDSSEIRVLTYQEHLEVAQALVGGK